MRNMLYILHKMTKIILKSISYSIIIFFCDGCEAETILNNALRSW
ncbi:Hypothetical protein GbCGDNIH7_7045 [Granulibacter bethesdensis]|nr:Hypothetical protein GbCGDNIH7_7045 [Granulibacter bethesdensis]